MTSSLSSAVSESRLRDLIDALQEFIVLKDGQGRWLIANQCVMDTCQLQGIDPVGKTDMELARLRPEFRDAFLYNVQTDEQAWQEGAPLRIQRPLVDMNGRLNVWEVIKTPTLDAAGRRDQLAIVGRNITERCLAEQALAASEQRYRLLTDNMLDIIGVFRPSLGIEYISPSLAQVLEHPVPSAPKNRLLTLLHPQDQPALTGAYRALRSNTLSHSTIECRLRHARGHYIWFETHLASTQTPGAASDSIVFACRNISARKAYDQHLKTLAYHDPLTGAPNRRFFMDRVQLRIRQALEADSNGFALLYLDLDRFKAINDRMGHEIGDELLSRLAKRLEAHLDSGDCYARIGGDEFVIMLADADESRALRFAENLCLALQAPWPLSCGALTTASSIGVALYPDAGPSVHRLLRHADEALYEAKRAGRARVILYQRKTRGEATVTLTPA